MGDITASNLVHAYKTSTALREQINAMMAQSSEKVILERIGHQVYYIINGLALVCRGWYRVGRG